MTTPPFSEIIEELEQDPMIGKLVRRLPGDRWSPPTFLFARWTGSWADVLEVYEHRQASKTSARSDIAATTDSRPTCPACGMPSPIHSVRPGEPPCPFNSPETP